MINLSGKVVLVTGGSQGLGSIICKELLNSKKQNTYRKNPPHRAILSVPVSLVSLISARVAVLGRSPSSRRSAQSW